MIKGLGSVAAVVAAAGLALSVSGTSEAATKRQFITIGTGGPTGVYFVVGNTICRLVHKEAAEGRKKGRKHGIRCSAPSSGGSTYNIGQIAAGEFDFGVAQSDWQYHAYNGTSDKVTKFNKLRAVFSVHPEPYHIIVGKDSGINSWAGLKGKRFNIGNPGSGQRGTTEVLMKAHGTKVGDFKLATELTSTEQSKALCDNKIDAMVFTVGHPSGSIKEATTTCDSVLVSVMGSAVDKLVMDNDYYRTATIPGGMYRGSDSDVQTFGVGATFVSSTAASADVVYEVVKAVFENFDDFRKLHPAFRHLQKAQMVKDGLSAPIHDGAAKYYKEAGLM
jgi:TRAP transporter TAXI family solute receptor